MTPEERELLEQAVSLSEANNVILRKMQRSGRVSLVLRLCYWAAIVFISFGAYYFVQPYINQIMSLLSVASNDVNTIQSLTNVLHK